MEPVLLRKEWGTTAGETEVGRVCHEGKRRKMELKSQEDLTSRVKLSFPLLVWDNPSHLNNLDLHTPPLSGRMWRTQEGCLMTSLHGGHFSPGKPSSQEVFFRKEVFLMGRACLQMDSNRRKPQVHWTKFYLTNETMSSHQQILTRHDIPSGLLRSFWYSKENLEHCGCYKRMVVFSLLGSIKWVILNCWVWGEIYPFWPFRKNKRQTDKLMLTEA